MGGFPVYLCGDSPIGLAPEKSVQEGDCAIGLLFVGEFDTSCLIHSIQMVSELSNLVLLYGLQDVIDISFP